MENPKYNLKRIGFSVIFLLACVLAGFSQSPSLTIDYDPIVCIENNDDRCRTYVNIDVSVSNFCPGVEITHDSPLTVGEDPSGIYLSGSYSFEVTARDTCGNEVSEIIRFEVKDCRAPTVICTYGLSIGLNANCEIPLPAFNMDAGSEDNCSEDSKLNFEIARLDDQGALYDRGDFLTFRASDVGNQRIALIATDEAGNEAYCETVVQIQCGSCDNNCGDTDTLQQEIIAGEFYTTSGYPMKDVSLYLKGLRFIGGKFIGEFDSPYRYDLSMLDSSGGYGLLFNGLYAEKTDDVGNGVSTIDLVLIRRAILELSDFNNIQKLAADVTNDQKFSTRDMIEIRKVILEQINAFSQVPSWIMFRSDFDFDSLGSDPWSNPIDFYFEDDENPFCYSLILGSGDTVGNTYDFIGLKMGDVSGDAGEDWARSGDPIGFITENKALSAGSVVEIPFRTNTQDLLGYQMTIDFDTDALELLSWSGELEDYNINAEHAKQGLLAISKVTEGSRSNERFNLTFAVKENAILSEVLRLSDEITSTEGYTDFQSRRPIHLEFNENENENVLTVFPNPMKELLVMEFEATSPGDYQLELFNSQGQLMYSEKWSVLTGENRRVLQREELNAASGWYLARISGPQGTETASIVLK